MASDRPILIIDCANLFIRSYAAYPTMSSHGYQMGGAIGFMKTLQRLVNDIAPKSVFLAWEGGGSTRRRQLYSEYKQNRKPEKLNRFYEDDIPDSDENKKHQMIALLSFMKCAPVCQIYVQDCEADDVIGYLTRIKFAGENIVIASSDRDMYQLLNQNVRIYNLHKKIFVNCEDVHKEFRVSAKNFALAKTLCGDPSDNIPGVKGLGYKTVSKILPILGSDNDIILQDIFNYCETHKNDSKYLQKILESKDDIRRNWKLIYLDSSILSSDQITKINTIVDNYKPSINRMKLIKLLVHEGITDFSSENFMYAFSCIENVNNGIIHE